MSDPKQSLLSENSLGAIAYITFVPAIFLLILAPNKKSSTVRFHAWQSIELHIAALIVTFALAISMIFGPLVYMSLGWMAWFVSALILWRCGVKALHGERSRLPMISALAEHLADNDWSAVLSIPKTIALDRTR
ncbi:MAG: hypothetical protein WAM85_22845 [Terracidiphilus sp.]